MITNSLINIFDLLVPTSATSSPAENGPDSNENSSSALDQAMAATLAAIEVPEPQDKSGRYLKPNKTSHLVLIKFLL